MAMEAPFSLNHILFDRRDRDVSHAEYARPTAIEKNPLHEESRTYRLFLGTERAFGHVRLARPAALAVALRNAGRHHAGWVEEISTLLISDNTAFQERKEFAAHDCSQYVERLGFVPAVTFLRQSDC